ncbi:hypothetical protein FQA39_LY17818 [Lamprigera yunnana]|nr:hypothetical protein FQA39_LY17818 [Lamprigera yunnana]
MGEVDQSIDLPWSIPGDYSMNNEARLLTYGNASEEAPINSMRYDLDNEGKYIKMGYSTHPDMQPVIRIRDAATGCADFCCNTRFNRNNKLTEIQKVLDQSSGDEISIQNMSKTDNITEDVKILYHWEYSEGLSLSMMSTIAAAASDPIKNENNFMKTVTLQRDYRTCTFNRNDVEAIFQLKSITNYRLELM